MLWTEFFIFFAKEKKIDYEYIFWMIVWLCLRGLLFPSNPTSYTSIECVLDLNKLSTLTYVVQVSGAGHIFANEYVTDFDQRSLTCWIGFCCHKQNFGNDTARLKICTLLTSKVVTSDLKISISLLSPSLCLNPWYTRYYFGIHFPQVTFKNWWFPG